VAEAFDELVIKEDQDKRGRHPGEVAALMAEEVRHQKNDKKYTVLLDELEAWRFALSQLGPGEIAVMFYESLQPAVHVVEQFGGRPSSSLISNQVPAGALS
jgi:cyanophycin synthetase